MNEKYLELISLLESIKTHCNLGHYKGHLNTAITLIKDLNKESEWPEETKAFKSITDSMVKIFDAKNHDYGNSFEKSLNEFGLIAAAVRIGDKLNRIKSLTEKVAKVKDESIQDTLLDLATYSIMTLMWLRTNNNGRTNETIQS